jgi:hypothetical protein
MRSLEFKNALEQYKSKAEGYLRQLEAAESAKANISIRISR